MAKQNNNKLNEPKIVHNDNKNIKSKDWLTFNNYNITRDLFDNEAHFNIEIISEILNNINDINFNFLSNSLPKSSFSREETAIKHLKSAYKDESLVLVLGAGVSFNYKIPTWDSLLQRLLIKTIEKEPDSAFLISKLFSKVFNPNPLIAGRYLQTYYGEKYKKDKNRFEREVQKALYDTYDENAHSLVIDEIIKLCLAPGNSPNIDSIITYNYDDIIERKLLEKNIDMPFESVYGQSIDTTKTNLKIFHVHGYLPKDGKINDENRITLGEFVYHEQYTNIYSWNNIVQINKFRDKVCLFIGASLSDPNTRRLLDIANSQKKQKKYHYIFKKKIEKNWLIERINFIFSQSPDIYNNNARDKLLSDDTVDFLIKYNNTYEEKDSESLGVKTVWINDYDKDISKILNNIRS